MILNALVEFAERLGLTNDLDYQLMRVRGLITIHPNGEMVGEITDFQGKNESTPSLRSIPKRSKRTTQNEAEFVVDKPEYVFAWVDPLRDQGTTERGPPNSVTKLRARARTRHDLYREEVRLAAERTGDEGLQALVRFLDRPQPALPGDLQESDLIAFRLSPDTDQLITDRPAVRAYWSRRRRERTCGSGRQPSSVPANPRPFGTCLVTGKPSELVELHPKIKGLPPISETKGGVQLTSANAPAFASYGLQHLGCAPVSVLAADAYEKALNYLLADKRRSYRLAHDTVVVFWSREGSPLVDRFADALAGEAESIQALYDSVWNGKPVLVDEATSFYSLTLSGGMGRGTIRAWSEMSLSATIRNLRDYFSDLEISCPANETGKPRPLLRLLRQLFPQRDPGKSVPDLAANVFTAILTGRPFPRIVLDLALRRARSEQSISSDQACFLKAYLIRARRAGNQSIPEVHPMLDASCKERGYLLGRLFAILEFVQDDAIGASACIRNRFFGTASTAPVVVFPHLTRKLPHHLKKLKRGIAIFYEKLIEEVVSGLSLPRPFPVTLTLEEQGLFAVGYYHQRQALFSRSASSVGAVAQVQSVGENDR